MAVSGDGYFLHAEDGGRVSCTSGCQGIPLWVRSGMTTKTGCITESARSLVRGRNLPVQDPGMCGSSRRMCREQEMDRSPSKMLQYPEDYSKPTQWHR